MRAGVGKSGTAGEFAELVRGQFMEERVEHFKRVETALYEETGFQEECTPAQVASALLSLDPELSEKQARGTSSCAACVHCQLAVDGPLKRLHLCWRTTNARMARDLLC